MLIEFKEVSKTYKYDFWSPAFFALQNASFSISEGKLIGFLGANGAGKTTSIKMMMDFIRPTSGEIYYSPSLGKTRKEVLAKIGFLPERPYFYPSLTGRQFCHYMGELHGLKRQQILERSTYWGNLFGINFAMERKISTYSKGMLQRLGFVSALLHEPQLIVLDEPLSGLDPVGRKEIKDALVELQRQGKTVFFSSHIVSDVEEICSQVIVLQKGQMIYQGSIDQLIEKHLSNNFIIQANIAQLDSFLQSYATQSPIEHRQQFIVPHEKKNQVLDHLQRSGAELLSLQMDRPTLEQIIYQIRGGSRG